MSHGRPTETTASIHSGRPTHRMEPSRQNGAGFQDGFQDDFEYEGDGKRVPLWNRVEERKLTGNSTPFRKNLGVYLKNHPEWEVHKCPESRDKDVKIHPNPKPDL